MKPSKLVSAVVLFLGGCQTYPDKPGYTVTVPGDYKAIADCFYEKVANPRGFIKTDLDSIHTSRITSGTSDVTTLRLDFVGVGPSMTEVRGFLGQAFASSNWNGSYKPIIEQCSKG